jgi:heme exporter protein C
MTWKYLSIALIIYTLIAGMIVPLKSGIESVSPAFAKTGDTIQVRVSGYNTMFTRPADAPTRIWFTFDEKHAVAGSDVKALNDRELEARFVLPASLPNGKASTFLNVIVDHATAGTSLLPAGIEVRQKEGISGDMSAWQQNPVGNLHVQKGMSFPYQNVIYESIRNTYYHVPMWFALMFMFIASVWHSIQFLRTGNKQSDRKAVAYTEIGVLFGLLGLFTGMVWANYAWGAPWNNDIKQITTAIALLIYLSYFILRSSFEDNEKGARLGAVYNIFAFSSLIPLLYIVPRMFASLHPGATGNPAFGSQDLDNTMRMVFYPAIIGWTLLGFWVGQLRARYLRLYDKVAQID